MPTRLFLRNLTSDPTPTAGEKSTALPVGTFSGNSGTAETRSLSEAKGAAQTSITLASLSQTAHQDNYLARFSSIPLAAQAIPAQTWTLAVATSEGNAQANSFTIGSIYVWRPSTNAVVGFLYDSDTAVGVEWLATEDGQVLSLTGSAVTAADGDILVLEFWRHATQGMAAVYTQTIFFEGTTDVTDATTADAASYLESAEVLQFLYTLLSQPGPVATLWWQPRLHSVQAFTYLQQRVPGDVDAPVPEAETTPFFLPRGWPLPYNAKKAWTYLWQTAPGDADAPVESETVAFYLPRGWPLPYFATKAWVFLFQTVPGPSAGPTGTTVVIVAAGI